MDKVYVVVAWYADSGEPDVLRAYRSLRKAESDAEMMKRTQPAKSIGIIETDLDESSLRA